MKEYAGSLIFDTKIDKSGFGNGLKGILSTLTKLGAGIGLALGFGGAIKEAEKYQNSIRGLTSIMEGQGRSVQEATNFIKEYTKDGLIPQTEAITAYKNLALRGYDTSQIEKVMKALKDSATYGRQASYSLGEAVQSATEGLKNENSILVDNAGVTKNVAKMWEEYAKSVGKNTNELSQQEKIAAEVNGILQETKFQAGDAASYTDFYSGRIAKLNAQFVEFKQNLGTSFMAIVSAVAPALNWLMNMLLTIANVFRAVIEVFLGVSLKQDKNAKSTQKATRAMNDYSKSVKNATKATSNLASFDKLTTLSSNKNNGGFGGGGGIGNEKLNMPNLKVKDMLPDLSKVNQEFEKIKKIIQDLKPLITGLLAGIASFFIIDKIQKIQQAIMGVQGTFKIGYSMIVGGLVTMATSISSLVNDWDNLDSKQKLIKIGLAVLGAAFVAFGYAVAAGLSAATLGIGALIALISTVIVTIVSFIAKIASEEKAIKSSEKATEDLKQAKEELNQAINDNIAAYDKEKETLNQLEEAQKKYGISGEKLNQMVRDGKLKYSEMNDAQKEVYKAYINHELAVEKLNKSIKELEESQHKERMASWEKTLALDAEKNKYDEYRDKVVQAYNEGKLSAKEAQELISKSMTDMSDKTQESFTKNIPESIKEGLDPGKYQTTWQKLVNLGKNSWDTIKENASNAFNGIRLNFDIMKAKIGNKIGELGAHFDNFKNNIGKGFENLKNNVVNLFQSGGRMFEGIKKGIADVFVNTVNLLIRGINRLIRAPFDLINGLLNKIKDVSVAGIKPFNGFWKYNPIPVPQIPRLAKGAVIPPRAEFLAVLGDQKNGRNLEGPENLFRKIVREETGTKGEIILNITNPIYVDGEKVAVQTIKKIIKIQELEGDIL